MRPLAAMLCLLFAVAAPAPAQEQEQGLSQRMNEQIDLTKENFMQNRAFAPRKFETEKFKTSDYLGVKAAETKTFETRSFLGIKNPWFGRKVYDTAAAQFSKKSARELQEEFEADAYEVREYANSRKGNAKDPEEILPNSAAPRPYLVPGKAQGAMDRFTENLQKDLTISDVRDLLNKGKDR